MKEEELNRLFQDEAKNREEKAKEKCGRSYKGRFQKMANEEGAIKAAIRLINKKNPSEGLTKLFDCERKYQSARELSIEKIYIEFAEKYSQEFPDSFPSEVVEKAKRKLGLM